MLYLRIDKNYKGDKPMGGVQKTRTTSIVMKININKKTNDYLKLINKKLDSNQQNLRHLL